MALHVSEDQQIGQMFRESDSEAMEFLGLNEQALRDEEQFHAYAAMEEHARIAEANGRIERAFVEGLGQLEAVIPTGIYFRMMALFGRDCWSDPEFMRHYQRCNPGARPKSRSRKTQVTVQGRSARAGTQAGGIILP